ncbi:MAG TPA: MmgE/PrpD family protein [Dehalococcoidia bacterium]|nr:MmgE/PrpD family protein [Dehalococcoidia bacterium]
MADDFGPLTQEVTEFIAGTTTADWPEETLELGRRHILDTIASIVVCGGRETALLARGFAAAQSGTVSDGAPILGSRERASLPDAVFASAMTAHGAEINDFCPSAFVQPGPAVVSTALCISEIDELPGAAVLRSVIAGYELTCRIPKALGVTNGRRLRYSSHGYAPIFGAAATAAALRGYSDTQINHMLSYCAQQTSGSLQWLLDVEHTEKSFVFAGMPARNGIHAALLVENGFTGVPDALESFGGWFSQPMFNAEGSDFDPRYLVEKLGERFEMPLVAYKRYPVGGPTQPVVQAMLELGQRVNRNEIERIEIEMPGSVTAFANAEMPALNLPYLCSIILIDGALQFEAADSLERMKGDAEVRALMPRVHVAHDPAQEAEPRIESARVTVTLAGGGTEQTFVEHVRGFPANPMDHDDVEAKALELMVPKLGEAASRRLVELVWGIDDLANAGVLVDAMVPA